MPQAEDLSRRLQQALCAAQVAAAEREQLQEILDVKGDRLAALEAEAAVREARLADTDAQLATALAMQAAEAASAEAAAAEAAAARGEARSLALQLEEAQAALAAAQQQVGSPWGHGVCGTCLAWGSSWLHSAHLAQPPRHILPFQTTHPTGCRPRGRPGRHADPAGRGGRGSGSQGGRRRGAGG